MTKSSERDRAAHSWPRYGIDIVRGALIGTVETVPGVSGGTVALVVRVYDTVITSAGHLFSGLLRAASDLPRRRGWSRAADEFRAVQWRVVVPLVFGMLAALLLMARFMEGWVEDYPVQTRALFFGMVLASLWVPFSLSTQTSREPGVKARWGWRDGVVAAGTAALAYVVVSLPPGEVSVTPPVIVLAAAVAVSALVIPGLSGSFLLLSIGLYETTLSAVNNRDLGYLALFALGAVIGLASVAKLLQWLLAHRPRITLVVLTGLMAGSLRALWPWQDDDRALLAPGEHSGTALALALLGLTIVLTVLLVEHRMRTAAGREANPVGQPPTGTPGR
ncbi:putative membrane protein [Prauserella marina]|uniref:Putative membrane protein n=1 Tax=Prauserella marina TaxID=530584 RepID=A0A1G6ZC00_9PSEU|nr:DUF368 domain-containing protein [Prauserella marina]PWV71009.1 putative membrane protein [Prauserella marina]SDD99607.1 putative membrane protein [Prauserella marina]